MSIKLIYGVNGEGKSELSKQLGNEGHFSINADINQIKFGAENQFSDYYTRQKRYDDQMMVISEKLLSETSSIFESLINLTTAEKKKTLTKLKSFLKDVDFQTFERWNLFYSTEFDGIRPVDVELHDALDLYGLIGEHPDLLNITLEQIEAAILGKQLSDLKNVDFSGVILNEFNTIIEVKDRILNILGETNTWLLDKTIPVLKKIKENRSNLDIDVALVSVIKNIIVSSSEFSELLRLEMEKTTELASAILFDQSIDGVTDGGKILSVSGNLSSGQLVVHVVSAIIKSVHASYQSGIYLDDVLEKLDNTNLSLMTSKLSSLDKSGVNNIYILTHNENTFEQVVELLENEGNEIEYMKIIKDASQQNIAWSLTPTGRPTLVFEKLHKELVSNQPLTPSIDYKAIELFAKVFGRMMNKAGALGNNTHIDTKNRSNYKMYDFTSNNVTHYETNVNLSEFNVLFGASFSIPVGQSQVDSIWLLNEIKNGIPLTGNKFGLSFEKIHNYIDDLIHALCHEREIYSSITRSASESKKDFAKTNWSATSSITISTTRPNLSWVQRCDIAHKFDYSLVSIKA